MRIRLAMVLSVALLLAFVQPAAKKRDVPWPGWTVRCNTDPLYATTECFAGTFGALPGFESDEKTTPFRVVFYDKDGPEVRPGFNTYPGRTPTVRVDDNPPIHDMRSPVLIEQLRSGKWALASYHVWPSGEERVSVKLDGFAEAYLELLRLSGAPDNTKERAEAIKSILDKREDMLREPAPPPSTN